MGNTQIPHYPGDSLKRFAVEYLKGAHPSGSIPIPIDEIVEGFQQVEIIPYPRLRNDRGVEGFPAPDGTKIYIDEDIMKHPNAKRFRFTVAHELAHVLLHPRVFKKATFLKVDDWISFLENVSTGEIQVIERQAYKLAGYLLVPPDPFMAQYLKMCDAMNAAGMNVASLGPSELGFIASKLGDFFDVSSGCILRIGVQEHLWSWDDLPPA